MRQRFALVSCVLFVLSAAAAGCSVDDVLPSAGQCVAAAPSSSCTDYTGSAWRTPSAASNACRQSGGTYYAGDCATANRVGSCRVQAGQSSELVQRFYAPYTAQAVQAGCAMSGGTYTAN